MRDGQQSLFATRMSQESVDKLLPHYEEAGFYAIEVWGGAVPDSVMRYLGECPWNRLKSISAKMQGKSLLTALSLLYATFYHTTLSYLSGVNQRFMDAVSLNVGIDNLFNYRPQAYDLVSGSLSPGITFYVSLSMDIDDLTRFFKRGR